MVLHPPQNLVLPSSGTTSSGQNGASAGWTWCFTPHKTLFFRRRAPRLWSKIGFGRLGVVLRSPQNLVLPSTGTTSLGQNGASAGWTWCFTPRNALFFRRRAPRLWSKIGFRPVGRGASLPAKPCSSVDGHHVFGAESDSAGWAWCFAPRKTTFFRRRAPRQHAYPNEEHASGKKSQFQLTLMKGDEVV